VKIHEDSNLQEIWETYFHIICTNASLREAIFGFFKISASKVRYEWLLWLQNEPRVGFCTKTFKPNLTRSSNCSWYTKYSELMNLYCTSIYWIMHSIWIHILYFNLLNYAFFVDPYTVLQHMDPYRMYNSIV
jgi:hypothetical protein